ncbi:hypothetical protein [Thermotoga sp. KOL6]|uniref:hypothetical protein n=1 Tax=Thermotoga sp. KOL6 TaxID=126741 RepID=UPI000C774FB9|nr:hypothetical protein [Thermotoga sp. KOL6]PLV58769.1 hypothetical protein AS005_07790 [Thermotoga sp. KOL6]
MKKVVFWSALITAGLLLLVSGCIPIPIPIDLGNPGLEPMVMEVPEGATSTTSEATWTSFTIRHQDIENAQREAGVPGTVQFHKIEVTGRIEVEGDLKVNGFIGFSTTEPTSTPTTGDFSLNIDTSIKPDYDISLSSDDSPALKTALNRINNGEDVTLWVILGYESIESTNGATVTITVNNVRLWITWTAW